MKNRSGFGWLSLIEGILLIVLGGYTIINPNRALTGFIVLYGIMAVITGIADILLYVRVAKFTGLGPVVSLISGTLSVMTGVVLLMYPNAGKLVLTLLFPLWFIAHCVSRLANLNFLRLTGGNAAYYFTLIMNIIGLVLGTLMILNPWVSWVSIRYVISFYLILLGIDSIVLAFSNISAR